ncbi:hypothetical protein AMATHDRAFT_76183 [Amanita thiersii Skay4041]|uniref:Protein transport protein SEC31 n=1 Tax=Amanita thiersii Skay4041 TaxID=703135 RepID=A0A2A9NP73_9AGAR|nr:hypothetical protein AMATHDRAFT_76183 [Amanita thiersii Skay4041]
MKLKEIYRTSTFAWSPTASLPLLATGTVAGALDESFSNESRLEIWEPDFLAREEFHLGRDDEHGPKHVVRDSSRYNRLAWGAVDGRPQGIIAAGLENGELALWDPAQILAGADTSELLILRNTTHTGPVRGLDFNPIQTSLLATGGVSGEVYIWDLKDPSKPYTPTPGTRSTKLDEITSVAWNQQVQYVLAGASTTGYTVVWDLRGKREVVALAYGGGAGTLAGQLGTTGSLAVGGRRGMSDIAWHPDNATRVVTASEDDTSPIIMVWDLRNARAPEKILTGHEKGVLSLSWCKQDADLLLSCGKDNRVLCWNPQTSEIIGELPSADNWAFQVDWCPRNPNLLATAFFDGTIGIHSLQSTNEPTTDRSAAAHTNGADIFDSTSISRASHGTFSLKQPPKWLRRPASSSFGFGGKLVTVSNLTNAQGKAQSSVVHIRKVATEQALIERAIKLQAAIEDDTLQSFAEARIQENETEPASEGWKALLSLFKANSRDELVMLLGFSQSEVAERVSEAIEKLKAAAANKSPEETDDFIDGTPREPVVSFAEPEREESEESDVEDAGPGSGETDKTPSEISASVTSDTASGVRQADAESTTTAPSLFGDDFGPGTPQEDFFNTIVQNDDGHHSVIIPHTNYGLDSSVAATIGSGPSSVTSESMKSNTFKIYPTDESETDRLVTKALVLGDFESAVSLCLSSDRFADAILLAVRGGPELLQRTQKAYFERRTTALPYLRLFQSIVTNDLSDIVQNADLQEWKEIFVVLCTFATNEEFSSLAEQLGSRLEYQFVIAKDSDNYIQADEYRKNATLTYLAAARLERLVNIWNEELAEEEKKTEFDGSDDESLYSAHVHSLQTFIEKVTAFRSATKYVDDDLSQKSDSNTAATIKTYKLSALYDRYFEYAEVLATQGLVKEAATFLKLTPSDYKGTTGTDLAVERERVFAASGAAPAPVASTSRQPVASTTVAQTTSYGGYPNYGVAPAVQPVAVPPVPQTTYSVYNPPAVTTNTGYAPNTYAPATTQAPYAAQPLQPQHQPAQAIPPPPRGHTGTPSHPPPPPKKDNSGWNDAPVVAAARAPSNLNLNKPAAITSPFPNATPSPGYSPTGSPYMNQGQAAAIPPPPRPNSVQQRAQIPPPPSGHKMAPPPPPQAGSGFHPGPRPGSQVGIMPPSLSHQVGHVGGQVPPRQPTPGQYASPPSRGSAGSVPPPGQFGPPGGPEGPVGVHPMQSPPQPHHMQGHPQHMQHPPPPTGPYAPPPQQQQGGPRMPPPQVGHQQSGPSHIMPPQQGMPPSQSMQHPPPPGGPSRGGPTQGSPAAPAKPQGPPPPKYPPGDRSHIPDHAKPAYNVINEHLNRMRQTTPPQQKRLADDLERRLNPLFDALNCETLSAPVVEQLLVLTKAMEAHDRPAALAIHVDLLTRGSQTDDIGLWMSGIKQLIMRM